MRVSVGGRYWRTRYARWWRGAVPAGGRETPGYTVLVPVPGDLPVFLSLALATIRAQTGRHRVATYVIPDQPSPEISRLVAEAATDWRGELRELRIGQPEATLLPRLGDPGRNHGVQLITGLEHTRSTHVVLHDADLLLLHPDIHDDQYAAALAGDLDVLGVSPAWDDWFGEHGLHLAATWELTGRLGWFRRFPPWRVISHEDEILDQTHMFDTTFWGQTQTPPERIAVRTVPEIVHFNYVISTYRKFARHGAGYADTYFRLLLIRLLSELADTAAPPRLPSFAELAAGLADLTAPVVYTPVDAPAFRAFRPQVEQILRGPWPAERIAAASRGIAPFDAAYGWDAAVVTDVPTLDTAADLHPTREIVDVTVIIPVLDRADLLAIALDSVAGQTVRPAEVIVVDDGSSDNSSEVARAWGATVIRNERPGGVGPARNQAMRIATGRWIAFLDSDDVWAPEHLAQLLRSATDETLLVTAPGITTHGRWWGNTRGYDVPLTLESLLVPGDGLLISGTMVRRDAALEVNGFPEDGKLVEDVALWIRLLRRGTGVETAYPTVRYLVHDAQMSHELGRVRTAFEDMVDAEAGSAMDDAMRLRHRSRQVWDRLRAAQSARDLAGVGAGVAFYARNPVALTALRALVAHRRRARLAYAALPDAYRTSFSMGRSGEQQTPAATAGHPGS